MIVLNPEFQRNIWIKFSPFRVIAMPVILGIILLLCIDMNRDTLINMLFQIGLNGFFIVMFLWGNLEAANSVGAEIRNNTWDFQRMSSIGPWQLALGKLFGATIYSWYFGLPLLAIASVCYYLGAAESMTVPLPALVIYALLAAIVGHAVAITTSLDYINQKKPSSFGPFFLGLVTSHLIYMSARAMTEDGLAVGRHQIASSLSDISWFGLAASPQIFTIGTVIFFSFWIIVALQRRMRAELQFVNTPVAWTLFCLTCAIYTAGIVSADLSEQGAAVVVASRSFACFLLLGLFLYISAGMESQRLANYRRFLTHFRERDRRAMWETMPVWMPVLVMTIIAFTVMNLLSANLPQSSPRHSHLGFTLAIFLFIVRDALALHIIRLGDRLKHSNFILLFYYGMMYVLLPLLFTSTLDNFGIVRSKNFAAYKDAMGFVASIFYPRFGEHGWQAVLPPLLQCLVLILVLKKSLRSLAAVRT